MIGIPAVIITDQGTEFKHKLNDELMKAFNIDHQLTTECITCIMVGESNVSGEINYSPLHSVLDTNSREIKYFKGPKYIRNFCSGSPKI